MDGKMSKKSETVWDLHVTALTRLNVTPGTTELKA